jgi:hypothetical protein
VQPPDGFGEGGAYEGAAAVEDLVGVGEGVGRSRVAGAA